MGLFLDRGPRSMAASTVFRGRFVEQNGLVVDRTGQLVASVTADVLVGFLQRKFSPLVMIEKGRLPFGAVMTVGARRNPGSGKLSTVDVLVAILTFRRRGLEIHMDQARLLVRRPVAIHASRGAMRSQQGEGCLRMIEAR